MPADPLAPLLDLPGVAAAVAAARADVDALLAHRVLRRRSAEITAESALRGARASAQLEGAGIELERLRGQLLAGGTVEPHDRDRRVGAVVASAVRLHADLGQVLPAWRRSPAQALARLHVVAAADLVDDPDRLGRPRGAGAPYEDPLGLGPAPDPLEVSARLVLVDRGLDPKAVSAPEVGHVELGHDYERAAQAYVSGGPDGVAAWLVHCARAVGLGALEGRAVCEALVRETPRAG